MPRNFNVLLTGRHIGEFSPCFAGSTCHIYTPGFGVGFEGFLGCIGGRSGLCMRARCSVDSGFNSKFSSPTSDTRTSSHILREEIDSPFTSASSLICLDGRCKTAPSKIRRGFRRPTSATPVPILSYRYLHCIIFSPSSSHLFGFIHVSSSSCSGDEDPVGMICYLDYPFGPNVERVSFTYAAAKMVYMRLFISSRPRSYLGSGLGAGSGSDVMPSRLALHYYHSWTGLSIFRVVIFISLIFSLRRTREEIAVGFRCAVVLLSWCSTRSHRSFDSA